MHEPPARPVPELGTIMTSETGVREAFEAMKVAAYRANKSDPDHPNSAAYTAMVCTLGWVLGNPDYAPMFEDVLRETKKMVGNRVQG